jgi:hypothetical protein
VATRLWWIWGEQIEYRGCGAVYPNQEQHHAKMTFEEEFIALLERHGIEYDPQYVFG